VTDGCSLLWQLRDALVPLMSASAHSLSSKPRRQPSFLSGDAFPAVQSAALGVPGLGSIGGREAEVASSSSLRVGGES